MASTQARASAAMEGEIAAERDVIAQVRAAYSSFVAADEIIDGCAGLWCVNAGHGREEIIEAARAAHAHEFILRLPQGYDSLVGERGQALSGGERQRISIARALLIDPRILILDEATSSVDTTTEMEIQEALDNLIQGRTTIAIAHRLSTLRKADRLVVLDRGQIVEVGNHDDLLARGGAYHELYQAQTRQLDADAPLETNQVSAHV